MLVRRLLNKPAYLVSYKGVLYEVSANSFSKTDLDFSVMRQGVDVVGLSLLSSSPNSFLCVSFLDGSESLVTIPLATANKIELAMRFVRPVFRCRMLNKDSIHLLWFLPQAMYDSASLASVRGVL